MAFKGNIRAFNKDPVYKVWRKLKGSKKEWGKMHREAVITCRPEALREGCLLELCNLSDRRSGLREHAAFAKS